MEIIITHILLKRKCFVFTGLTRFSSTGFRVDAFQLGNINLLVFSGMHCKDYFRQDGQDQELSLHQ